MVSTDANVTLLSVSHGLPLYKTRVIIIVINLRYHYLVSGYRADSTNEIHESQRALDGPKEDIIYRRDRSKRIDLINWVLENMKHPNVETCSLLEYRMNETIQEIKKKDSIFESDILDSELQILDWIFYQVCKPTKEIGHTMITC